LSHDILAYLLVCGVGLAAGLVSGVVGTGSSILLLPVLVYAFGPKQAVPIMAVAAVMSNLAKVMAWRREVNWRAFAAYSAAGIPAAALGARTLLALPAHFVDVALGVFFLAMMPMRRWLKARDFHISLWQLALSGAVIGFITGIVVSTGPLSVPAFLAFGLSTGAFLSTEAMSSLVIYLAKVSTFRAFGALPLDVILQGLIAGSTLMVGAFAGKAVVLRMSTAMFEHALDAMLLVAGLALLWAAFN